MATLINDDIPENWQANQIISPNGEPFADEKRGWNFLMRKINTMIRQINSNSQDVEDRIKFELVDVLPDPEDANEQTFYQIEVEEDKYKLYYFLDGAFRPITPSWGDIDGTLSNQTDLQNALNALVSKVQSGGAGKPILVGNDNNIKAGQVATYIKRNTAYSVGDIAYSEKLGAGYYLECVQAGTTGSTEPDWN